MLLYLVGITLGPLLMGASVLLTSLAISASGGLVEGVPGGVGLLLDLFQFVLLAAGTAALYRYVPNTRVRWSHAWIGGLFVSSVMELAKKLLVLYLGKVPTYSLVYGTFATVPILLVWIYLAWVIVLLGAVIAAYLPSLKAGIVRRPMGAGWRFQLALECLQLLHRSRGAQDRGLSVEQLAAGLRVSHLGVESVLEVLLQLDWVARLEPGAGLAPPSYILLADPDATLLQPLLVELLLPRTPGTDRLWINAGWGSARLRDVL